MDRRSFLQSIGAAALSPRLQPRVGPSTSSGPPGPAGGRKAVLISLLPGGVPGAADAPAAPGRVQSVLPYLDRFALARDAGFDAIEMQTISRNEEAAEIREASEKSGLRIHSVMNADHWRFPLSSSDRDVVSLDAGAAKQHNQHVLRSREFGHIAKRVPDNALGSLAIS